MSYLSRERGDFCGFFGLGEITRSKARSSAPGLSSTSISRAVSMNRLNCSGLSGLGFGLRGMDAAYVHAGQSSNGTAIGADLLVPAAGGDYQTGGGDSRRASAVVS